MDTDSIVRGRGPENTVYDKARHERMKLRDLYGGLRFFPPEQVTCCEACVYGSEKHAPFCTAWNKTDEYREFLDRMNS